MASHMSVYHQIGVLSGALRENFLIFFSAGVSHSMGNTHDGVYRVGLVTLGVKAKCTWRKPSSWMTVEYDSEVQTDMSGKVCLFVGLV